MCLWGGWGWWGGTFFPWLFVFGEGEGRGERRGRGETKWVSWLFFALGKVPQTAQEDNRGVRRRGVFAQKETHLKKIGVLLHF